MAWKNGYYYENKRVGRRVITRYYGADFAAHLAEQMTQQARLAAETKRREWQAIKDEEQRLDKLVKEMSTVSQQLVTALMLATGHYQHKNQWRKKRERSSD